MNKNRNTTAYIKMLGSLHIVFLYFNTCISNALNNHRMSLVFKGELTNAKNALFEELMISLIQVLPSCIISAFPVILFLIYIAVGYKKKKNHFLMKVSILAFFILNVLSLVSMIGKFIEVLSWNNFSEGYNSLLMLWIIIRVRNVIEWGIYTLVAFCNFKFLNAAKAMSVISLFMVVLERMMFFVLYETYGALKVEYWELVQSVFDCLLLEVMMIVFWYRAAPLRNKTPQVMVQQFNRQF